MPEQRITLVTPDSSVQILLHHHDLGAEVDERTEIERVSGENHEIELRRGGEQPVELRQRIMQISDNQTTHNRQIQMPED